MFKKKMINKLLDCWRENERFATRERGSRRSTSAACGISPEYYSTLVATNSTVVPSLQIALDLAAHHGYSIDEMLRAPAVFAKIEPGERPATSVENFRQYVADFLDGAPRGTQQQLADAIDMSTEHLSRLRRSGRDPKAPQHQVQFDNAIKIALFLQVPLADMCSAEPARAAR